MLPDPPWIPRPNAPRISPDPSSRRTYRPISVSRSAAVQTSVLTAVYQRTKCLSCSCWIFFFGFAVLACGVARCAHAPSKSDVKRLVVLPTSKNFVFDRDIGFLRGTRYHGDFCHRIFCSKRCPEGVGRRESRGSRDGARVAENGSSVNMTNFFFV